MENISLAACLEHGFEDILTPDCLEFVKKLHDNFEKRRQDLLVKRIERQKKLDSGEKPTFLPETAQIRLRRESTP